MTRFTRVNHLAKTQNKSRGGRTHARRANELASTHNNLRGSEMHAGTGSPLPGAILGAKTDVQKMKCLCRLRTKTKRAMGKGGTRFKTGELQIISKNANSICSHVKTHQFYKIYWHWRLTSKAPPRILAPASQNSSVIGWYWLGLANEGLVPRFGTCCGS